MRMIPTPMPQKKVRLGQIFSASQEAGSRLLLGQYQSTGNNPGWSEMLGWVDKADLLEDRIAPLTVGEAINKGLNVKQSNAVGGLAPQNSLYVRIITQPERLVKPRNNPDDETGTGKTINSFTWYYVYDVVKHQGKSWVLAGNTPRLASDDLFENTVGVAGPENVLLGWLPLKKITIWASNLVLELNTSPEAVKYRVQNNKPATVKAEPEKGSKNLYVEPLKILWPNGKENPDYQDSVRLDPYGLSPDFPRLPVIQAWPDGWLEVALVAYINKKIKFFQGYVPLNEIEFSRLDANQIGEEHPKSYRLRVMLSVGEVIDLRDITKKVAGGLKTALTTLGMDDDPLADFLESAEPKAKKLLICEIVLLVRDQVTGENRYGGQSGQKKLKQAAEKLLSRIQSGQLAGTSLGRVLLIPDSLPFRVDSFMSMSLAKVLDQEKPWFLKQINKLKLKAIGLDRILNNGVVPEDFNAIRTAPANIGKRWRFSNNLNSTISYIYVPIGYIP
jgi:hypothetical protein